MIGQTINNYKLHEKENEEKDLPYNMVRHIEHRERGTYGTCPSCKNYIHKIYSKERCQVCHTPICWEKDKQ